ncbi:rCG20894 [Rattus norvegicus]|uniref:RCG20894 n=1 Tax=Rattus norvegicus TaxID=10116 RepID=A6JEK4_RAT|nr:rCG20894 [Rattus norvegicus]
MQRATHLGMSQHGVMTGIPLGMEPRTSRMPFKCFCCQITPPDHHRGPGKKSTPNHHSYLPCTQHIFAELCVAILLLPKLSLGNVTRDGAVQNLTMSMYL